MERIFEEVISKNTWKYSLGKKQVTLHFTGKGEEPTISWSSASLTRNGFETPEETLNMSRLLIHVVNQVGLSKI